MFNFSFNSLINSVCELILKATFSLFKKLYISVKLCVYGPWKIIELLQATSIGFCPPWFTKDPPIKTYFDNLRIFLVFPYELITKISILSLILLIVSEVKKFSLVFIIFFIPKFRFNKIHYINE